MPSSIDNGFQTITIALNIAKENVMDHLKESSLISIKHEPIETNQEHIDSGLDHSQETLTTESVDAKQRYELRR